MPATVERAVAVDQHVRAKINGCSHHTAPRPAHALPPCAGKRRHQLHADPGGRRNRQAHVRVSCGMGWWPALEGACAQPGEGGRGSLSSRCIRRLCAVAYLLLDIFATVELYPNAAAFWRHALLTLWRALLTLPRN